MLRRATAELRDRWRLGVTVGAALAPDLDLTFRFVDGRNHHDYELHSIGFALLAAALRWLLAFRLLRRRAAARPRRWSPVSRGRATSCSTT